MKLRDGLLIPDFILNAIAGEELVIYGEDSMHQSLCFVSDMVDGIVRLMNTGPEISLVNLGSDHAERMGDIARRIIEMTRSTSTIRYENPLIFLTKKGIPDLRRAKEQLGWIPLIGLEDGLRRTIDYTLAHKETLSFASG
jgi:UDP-glucuronate decarboxylase